MCTKVHKTLFESHLRYCALVITKLLKVSILDVILDQNLNFNCHCALRITLSKNVTELRIFNELKTKSTALSYCNYSFVLPMVTLSSAPILMHFFRMKKKKRAKV